MITRPRWLAPTSLILSIVGLLVSAYLTYEHYTGNETLVCTVTGVIDCGKVTSSAWSTFMGVPVALLGLLFFVALTILVLPSVWRRTEPWLDWLRFGLLTIAPNLLPVLAVLGVMGYLDISMNVATVMVASVALGIVEKCCSSTVSEGGEPSR